MKNGVKQSAMNTMHEQNLLTGSEQQTHDGQAVLCAARASLTVEQGKQSETEKSSAARGYNRPVPHRAKADGHRCRRKESETGKM